jgi:hypothetical protein
MENDLRLSLSMCSVLRIPFDAIAHAELLFREEFLAGAGGINPVDGRKTALPPEAKPSMAELIADARRKGLIDATEYLVCVSGRNGFQNGRCPLLARRTKQLIWQRNDEDPRESKRPYPGIACLSDNTFAVLSMDFQRVPGNVKWFIAGIPVQIGGRVLETAEIITSVYDPPHLFDLRVSAARGITRGNDGDLAKQIQATFVEHLYSTQEDASLALTARVAELGPFNIQEDYFHHAIAVGDDAVYDIMAHASLQDIGRLSLAVGARGGCIVCDNGGSPEQAHMAPSEGLRGLVRNFYWRAPTIACVAFALREGTEKNRPFADRNVVRPFREAWPA